MILFLCVLHFSPVVLHISSVHSSYFFGPVAGLLVLAVRTWRLIWRAGTGAVVVEGGLEGGTGNGAIVDDDTGTSEATGPVAGVSDSGLDVGS